MPSNNPPSMVGLPGIIHDFQSRLTSVEAKTVRPEAAQSLYNGLGKGIVARQKLTANSGATPGLGVPDWLLADVPVDSSRLYAICMKSNATFSAASQWNFDIRADGVIFDTFWRQSQIGAGQVLPLNVRMLWEPDTGTPDLDFIVGTTVAGTVTFTYTNTTNSIRWFWVEDIGPR